MNCTNSKWAKKVPRPTLNWLSRNEIWDVRDKLIGIFLSPGEFLELMCPMSQGVIHIAPSAVPRFEIKNVGKFWLKCPKDRNPYWDWLGEGEVTIEHLKFNDETARPVAMLVEHLTRYFPFVPTDNFLTHDKSQFYA